MSFVKNKKPKETFTYASGWTKSIWKNHLKDCNAFCPCCNGDWDCNCGAVTWEKR